MKTAESTSLSSASAIAILMVFCTPGLTGATSVRTLVYPSNCVPDEPGGLLTYGLQFGPEPVPDDPQLMLLMATAVLVPGISA
jgi:hypothetical protein